MPKFSDIRGVLLQKKDDAEGKKYRFIRRLEDKDKYFVASLGDAIFVVDPKTMTVDKKIVKFVKNYHDGVVTLFYCNNGFEKDFLPTEQTWYTPEKELKYCKKVHLIKTKSSQGLFSTTPSGAKKIVENLKKNNFFGNLNVGDNVYLLDKADETIIEETVKSIGKENEYGNKLYEIDCKDYAFELTTSKYENNASVYNDKGFRLHTRRRPFDEKMFYLFVNKADAEKALKTYKSDKEKRAKKKEDSKPKIGTKIRHTDNKGKELRIGDLVAYVRKDWGGHTDISFGVIISDSEKKIRIFDKEEFEYMKKKIEEKQNTWQDKCEDGIHSLEKENIILVKKVSV